MNTKSIITRIAAILAAGIPWSGLYAQGRGYNGMNHFMGSMMYGGWGVAGMWIGAVVLIAIVIFLFVKISGGPQHSGNDDTPLDILKRRYANGEISDEQFRKMKQQLQ